MSIIIVVHRRRKDNRWIASRQTQAWEKRSGRAMAMPWARRRQLVTGGDHDTWRCAKSWAEAHLRRLRAQGYAVPDLVVDRNDPPKDGRYPLTH